MSDPTDEADVRAALRDASWHPNPNVDPREPKKYHVIYEGAAAACDQRIRRLILDIDGSNIPASDAPVHLRCNRPGCAKRWPERAS